MRGYINFLLGGGVVVTDSFLHDYHWQSAVPQFICNWEASFLLSEPQFLHSIRDTGDLGDGVHCWSHKIQDLFFPASPSPDLLFDEGLVSRTSSITDQIWASPQECIVWPISGKTSEHLQLDSLPSLSGITILIGASLCARLGMHHNSSHNVRLAQGIYHPISFFRIHFTCVITTMSL